MTVKSSVVILGVGRWGGGCFQLRLMQKRCPKCVFMWVNARRQPLKFYHDSNVLLSSFLWTGRCQKLRHKSCGKCRPPYLFVWKNYVFFDMSYQILVFIYSPHYNDWANLYSILYFRIFCILIYIMLRWNGFVFLQLTKSEIVQ